MILEEETFKKFGYRPSKLAPQSNKLVLAKCEDCGETRILKKQAYRNLCKKCAFKGERNPFYGKKHSKESLEKMREWVPSDETIKRMKENRPNIKGENNPFYGKHHNEKTKAVLRNKALERKDNGFFANENHPFYGKHHSEETKKKISDTLKGKNIKENSPNWKGGISSLKFETAHEMTIREWMDLAKEIRKRDNYICQYCGETLSYEVHHITPRRIEIDNHPDNLITLCKPCHLKIEHLTDKYIKQNRNPIEIFYEKWSE